MTTEDKTAAHRAPDDFLELLSHPDFRRRFEEAVASAVNRHTLGIERDSPNIDRLQVLAAGIASSQYAIRHMSNARRYRDEFHLLQYAIEAATFKDGLVLEFGVYSGRTLNHIAKLLPARKIFGFDSFEGLPETWRPGFDKGAFSVEHLPDVLENVELVVGWFDRSLPEFLDRITEKRVALLHVDCDLYSSTQVIFQKLRDRLVPGTIIVFDEYFNYPGWELNEFRAFKEFVEVNCIHYDYIGIVPGHQQVAVRIVG